MVTPAKEAPAMIPVLGVCTLKRFDLAERMLASIDHEVEHLVIVDNSGTQEWQPPRVANAKHQWNIQVPYGLGIVGAWNLIIKSTPYAPWWLLINDDAWFEPGALATIAEQTDPEALNHLDIQPIWSAVVVGEEAVAKAGLIDEAYYPIYFDDNDWQRRIEHAGVPVKNIAAKIHHDNSSTLNSGYHQQNHRTFAANAKRYETKVATDDFSVHGWDLTIRRDNRWD